MPQSVNIDSLELLLCQWETQRQCWIEDKEINAKAGHMQAVREAMTKIETISWSISTLERTIHPRATFVEPCQGCQHLGQKLSDVRRVMYTRPCPQYASMRDPKWCSYFEPVHKPCEFEYPALGDRVRCQKAGSAHEGIEGDVVRTPTLRNNTYLISFEDGQLRSYYACDLELVGTRCPSGY